MSLPNGAELAWFLSGMWAALFILRAGRAADSGFFAVIATLFVAAVPALGLLFETQLVQMAAMVQEAIRNR
jgi:hypothetical protein